LLAISAQAVRNTIPKPFRNPNDEGERKRREDDTKISGAET
jgi:hypothetical protein